MKRRIFILALLLFVIPVLFPANSSADISRYTYPYDISQLEWQLLNWTAAWRGTITPADPYILERMEYNRTERKIYLYVKGTSFAQEDLNSSIKNITDTFQKTFLQFAPETDLVVDYRSGKDTVMEYRDGNFVNSSRTSTQASMGTSMATTSMGSY